MAHWRDVVAHWGDVVAHCWRCGGSLERCGGSLVAHQISRAEVPGSNPASPTII